LAQRRARQSRGGLRQGVGRAQIERLGRSITFGRCSPETRDPGDFGRGAVLDEKMKDAVKITVIATGFKESGMRRPRQHESSDPVIVSRHFERSYPPDPAFDSPPVMEQEPKFEPDPAPVAFQSLSPMQAGSSQAEVISLDSMRVPPPSYTPDDLDVPAFLRKQGGGNPANE
jgi:hypothetical protein